MFQAIRATLVFLFIISSSVAAAAKKDPNACLNKISEGGEPTVSIEDVVYTPQGNDSKIDIWSLRKQSLWQNGSAADRKVLIEAFLQQKDVPSAQVLMQVINAYGDYSPRARDLNEYYEVKSTAENLNDELQSRFTSPEDRKLLKAILSSLVRAKNGEYLRKLGISSQFGSPLSRRQVSKLRGETDEMIATLYSEQSDGSDIRKDFYALANASWRLGDLESILEYHHGIALFIGNEYTPEDYEDEEKNGYNVVRTANELYEILEETEGLLAKNQELFKAVLDNSDEDLMTYEFYDSGSRNSGANAANLNILRYAVRYADIELLSTLVNHPKFHQTQSFEQGKVLLADAKLRNKTVREGVKMAVFISMTVEAYKKHSRTLGEKIKDGFQSIFN